MVKVSISLPNNTQITFESEEAEVLHEVVGMVLRDLPRDLMQAPSAGDGRQASTSQEKSTSVAAPVLSAAAANAPEPEPDPPSPPVEPTGASAPVAPQQAPRASTGRRNGNGTSAAETPPELLSEEGRENFAVFCQEASPLGDMRRVVVAAEGASRHFGIEGVNAEDLGLLFDMAGWRRPGNFTQTLRNAARSKFGWLERIPGRSGRYAATPKGVAKTLGG